MCVVQRGEKTMKASKSITDVYKKENRFKTTMHRLLKNKGAVVGLIIILILIVLSLTSNVLFDYEKDIVEFHTKERLQGPSSEHLFGTDNYGRDIFKRIVYGTKYSIAIGFVAVIIALAGGVFLGAVAGYYGGFLEDIIMRICDIMSSIPTILLGIVIVSAIGGSVGSLMIAIGVAAISGFARITRASILTIKNQEYIESARAMGLSDLRIIFGHVLPNCLSPIIVQTTLKIGNAVVSASSLSFLGMGVPSPKPEWGTMLSAGREFLRKSSYMTLFPGLAIMITVLAFNLVGDGLRDALDPKLKK